MDKTLASNRRRYLHLVRALLKRDKVTLIEVDEMREHAGVFLVSNLHFLPPPGVSLVALENDDEDPGELSGLAGLHLGLADVKDAFHRFKISKLYSSFFALPEVEGQEVGAPLVGRLCSCFSSLPMGHTWSLFLCQKAVEEAMWPTPGLGKAERGPPGHPELRRPTLLWCVDDLGVLGTSRVKVDRDLMTAVQTLKNRSLDTHEEIFTRTRSTALGIHIDLRKMLVSVAPMRLWRLKQGLRWALRCWALPGKTWKVLLKHITFVALLRRDVLSVPFALNKFIRAIFLTLRVCGQVPEPKCKPLSAFCRQSLAAGHVVGVHPLLRQMQASMVLVFV